MYNLLIKNDLLLSVAIRLSITKPFYYYILAQCTFREVFLPGFTAGVYFKKNSTMMFSYNPEFLNPLTPEQIEFVIIHEVQHLISNHPRRMFSLGLHKEMANIAADMIINTNIIEQFKIAMPTMMIEGKEQKIGLEIPPDYKEERIMEILYAWLDKKTPPFKKITLHLEGTDGKGNKMEADVDAYQGKDGNIYIDKEEMNKASGSENEVPDAMKEALIDNLISAGQNRGLLDGGDEAMLNRIRRSKKNYLALIKAYVSTLLGTQKKVSFKKFSRKYDLMPGFHRVKDEINVILDTSGSMTGMIEKVLSYVFYHDIVCNIVQCDTKVHQVIKCTCPHDIQKMKVEGFGGTILQPAIDFIAERKDLRVLPLVLLTDGYCDSLNFDKLHSKVLAITCGTDIPLSSRNKPIKVIKVDTK
jgi:predicted metal-dependent peptidase